MTDLKKKIDLALISKAPEVRKSFFERKKESLLVFFYQFLSGFHWFWQRSFGPLLSYLRSIYSFLFGIYHSIWNRFVYDGETFSKKRAGIVVTSTVLFVYFFFTIISLGFNTLNYLVTVNRNETVFMTNSQEIDHEGDIHSAQGCIALPCDEENSIYFRIEPTLFNVVHEFVTKGQIFYPDYVAAAIPPGVNKCVITSYGVRWKMFMRGWEIYPHIIKASCTPVFE